MKTYKYIALAALALSFAACSQEDDFIPQGNQKGAPITIASVGVANLATRATIEDDKLVEGNIGVTITSTGNDDRYKGSNVRWYGSNGVWGLVENQKVVLYEGNGESQKIYAYYPYAKDIIEGTENLPVTLPEAFGSNFEGYDYLCTKEGISLSQNPVSLTLSHAFSKVSVSVNVMGNELEGDVVTEIALVNVPFNGERSATTGAMVPGKYSQPNATIALYGYDSDDTDEEADYYIGYALPNAANTLDLRVTMQSGRIFTATAPITGGMTDGVHYKIGLNLGKDKVSISSVIVADWNEEEIDGGVAEEVILTYEYDATTNTYKVYQGEYLQTAFDEAEQTSSAEHPATVKIMRDMEVTGIPNESGNVKQDLLMDAGEIVLDLNGHTLTGKTDLATIRINNGAKLTIDDSSESKSGKIQYLLHNLDHHVVVCEKGSTLVVNNGTFEGGVCAVYGYSLSIIEINGGTFKATETAISPQDATLTITGGTFDGGVEALRLHIATTIALIAGGSFTGGEYDIYTAGKSGFLSYNAEDGVGPTFPGGLSIYDYTNSHTLTDLLTNGAAYYDSSGNQLTLADAATSCEGDVTVKKIPTDE